jgi:hypothetical protein
MLALHVFSHMAVSTYQERLLPFANLVEFMATALLATGQKQYALWGESLETVSKSCSAAFVTALHSDE